MRSLIAVAVLLSAGCGGVEKANSPEPEQPGIQPATGEWRQLPTPPLSPRLGAVTAWTGEEALFLGGDTSPPCPPNADCALPSDAYAFDGAAYDPARDTWRPTAPAPIRIAPYAPHAVINDEVFIVVEDRMISYDASEDRWSMHPDLPAGSEYPQLTTVDGGIVAVESTRKRHSGPDQIYKPSDRTWSPLPADPLGPSFDRVATLTSHGLVLTGQDLVRQPGVEPSYVHATVLDLDSMRWGPVTKSDQIGGWQWTWTGKRLVDPSLGGADGGETNPYGRTIPYGGAFDPETQRWTHLDNVPGESTGGWTAEALAGPLAATGGWVYDDRERTYSKLLQPAGAPPDPGSAIWADGKLIVVGGVDFSKGMTEDALSDKAWIYDPAP